MGRNGIGIRSVIILGAGARAQAPGQRAYLRKIRANELTREGVFVQTSISKPLLARKKSH